MAWLVPIKATVEDGKLGAPIASDEKALRIPDVAKTTFRTPHTEGWLGGDVVPYGVGSYPVASL